MRPKSILILSILAVAAGSSACAPVLAQTPPEGIVWIAVRDINEDYSDPDDPTNRPPLVHEAPEGMIRQVNVSDDGRPDWLIDYQASGLDDYCGTGGCLQRLYVSVGDGYVQAIDNQTLALTIERGRVEARVHHLYCADDDPDCRYIFFWDARARNLRLERTTSARPMGDDGWTPIRRPEE